MLRFLSKGVYVRLFISVILVLFFLDKEVIAGVDPAPQMLSDLGKYYSEMMNLVIEYGQILVIALCFVGILGFLLKH